VGAANAGPFDVAGVVDTPDGARWVEAPAHGIGSVLDGLPDGVAPVSADGTTFDNGLVRVTIAGDGTLTSLVDLRVDRECLAAPANVLQLFPDHPNTYDAWDVDAHTLRLPPTELTDVDELTVDESELQASATVRRSFGASTITQTYVLRAGSARLDIVTEVDWHEDETLLKAAFPLDVRADDARYEVQYGHVRRPIHRNTSWDDARFEVCGHFWADVSEPDFGVAVLNDSKYGHDCLPAGAGSTMRLTLLRAPNYPDPDADRGHHRFTYSLLPHGPTLADVLAESWALNLPVRVTAGGPRPSLVAVDHPGVVVTAVKAADDASGDIVVRMYEAFGGRARGTLTFGIPVAGAVVSDLLERPTGETEPVAGDALAFELRPFEVRTLRLTRP
jgi:alpha-mannosidase